MAYREGAFPLSEHRKAEDAAIAALVLRTWRVRAVTITVVTLCGVLCGALFYDLLSTWQLARRGVHIPFVTGVMSFVPTFGAALWIAPHVARSFLHLLTPGWRRALAARHGLDAEEFAYVTALSDE